MTNKHNHYKSESKSEINKTNWSSDCHTVSNTFIYIVVTKFLKIINKYIFLLTKDKTLFILFKVNTKLRLLLRVFKRDMLY